MWKYFQWAVFFSLDSSRWSIVFNGFWGYVQGTRKEPKDGQPVNFTNIPDFEDYGLGAFLPAGSEVCKLKK